MEKPFALGLLLLVVASVVAYIFNPALANKFVPAIAFLWGGKGIKEFFKKEPIEIHWYSVPADANPGIRVFYLVCSFVIILGGVKAFTL